MECSWLINFIVPVSVSEATHDLLLCTCVMSVHDTSGE